MKGIEPSAIADCVAQKDAFVWFDASEPTGEDIAALGQAFHLHPLTLEDIGHRRQRPRVELFEDYGFITMRPLSLHGDDLTEHEVHAVVGKRFLGTLRYGPDPFPIDEVVKRWQRQPELLASDPGGFAVYVLFDEVVDGYLNIVEQLEDTADDLEDLVFADDPSVDRPQVQERIFVAQARGRAAAPLLLADAPGARPAPGAAGARRRRAAAVLPRRDGARDPRLGARRQHPRPADLAVRAPGRAESRTT